MQRLVLVVRFYARDDFFKWNIIMQVIYVFQLQKIKEIIECIWIGKQELLPLPLSTMLFNCEGRIMMCVLTLCNKLALEIISMVYNSSNNKRCFLFEFIWLWQLRFSELWNLILQWWQPLYPLNLKMKERISLFTIFHESYPLE